jgi:hypothetical protein
VAARHVGRGNGWREVPPARILGAVGAFVCGGAPRWAAGGAVSKDGPSGKKPREILPVMFCSFYVMLGSAAMHANFSSPLCLLETCNMRKCKIRIHMLLVGF